MKISDSVALVTGANRGLGRAYAQAFVAAGARKVYAAARDPSKIDLPGVTPMRLDVTQPDQVRAAARECADVNVLVNNAGVGQPSSFLGEGAVQKARDHLETNFFGMLEMSRAFAPVLAGNGGGVLANMLSVLTWFSLPNVGGYCASKAAAWSLTNALRAELRGQGTQVVAIHAAFIDTDMAKGVTLPKASPADIAQQLLRAIESGAEEVLADDWTRRVKAALSADPGPYLKPPAP